MSNSEIINIISITVITINIIITWKLNLASKIKEIKLANYLKEQIDKTKDLYSLIFDMEHVTNKLFSIDTSSWSTDKLKRLIDSWNNIFGKSYMFYHRNRILFPDDLKHKLNIHFDEMEKVSKRLLDEKSSLYEEEAHFAHYGYYSNYDEDLENKYIEIKKTDFNLRFNSIDLQQKFTTIRESLEVFFNNRISQ